MAKSLGNISYSEIVKNREKVTRREGISRETFEKLMQRINICGFENEDGNITVYFNNEDIKEFESIVINTDIDLKIIAEKIDSLDDKFAKIYEMISAVNTKKELEEDIRIINKRLDSMTEYLSEYCSIINEIKNNDFNSTKCETSIIEADGCITRMNELIDRFDSLYGDIIRNIACMRSDLKIETGRKSFSKRKKAFLIYLFRVLTSVIVFIILKKLILRWFL